MRTHLAASTKFARAESPPFNIMGEAFGDGAENWVQDRLDWQLHDGVGLHTVLTSNHKTWLEANDIPFIYWAMPSSVTPADEFYPTTMDDNAPAVMVDIRADSTARLYRLIATEPDQLGGGWATGRPSFSGLTNQQAYDQFNTYYLTTKGLGALLTTNESQRGYWKNLIQNVHAMSSYYWYEAGVDTLVLERLTDEVPGMVTGITQLRGAATQYGGREWGMDISGYRTWDSGALFLATTYDDEDRMENGWSRATIKRHLYMSYMCGATILDYEARAYESLDPTNSGGLNPIGLAVQDLYNFVFVRHPDRGRPHVPFAFVQDHMSGFEPKFGEWGNGDVKWLLANSYTNGDRMTERALALVYPEYAQWGRIVAGAPWRIENPPGTIDIEASQDDYRARLAADEDPRPWEPMGSTRYGISIDLITDASNLAALRNYPVLMITATAISTDFWTVLTQYVAGGGILIVSTAQLPTGHGTVSGLSALGSTSTASASTWVADTSTITEASGFTYRLVTLGAATNIATAAGNSVITRNAHGSGYCYVTTPLWGLNTAATTMLLVVRKLLDELYDARTLVRVSTTTDLIYLVSKGQTKTVVTLVNTNLAGSAYSGTLSFPVPPSTYRGREWTADIDVATSVVSSRVEMTATVPAYDVAVYVLDWGPVVGNRLPFEDYSFENTIGNWLALVNCAITRVPRNAAVGNMSMRVTITAALTDAAAGLNAASAGAYIPVTAGKAFSLSLKSKAAATACYFLPQAQFYTAATGAAFLTSIDGTGGYDTTSTWTTQSVSGTVPATATHVLVNVYYYQPAGAAEIHDVDDVQFIGGA